MRRLERLWPLSPTAKVGAGALLLMLVAMYGGYRVEHQAYVEAGRTGYPTVLSGRFSAKWRPTGPLAAFRGGR